MDQVRWMAPILNLRHRSPDEPVFLEPRPRCAVEPSGSSFRHGGERGSVAGGHPPRGTRRLVLGGEAAYTVAPQVPSSIG